MPLRHDLHRALVLSAATLLLGGLLAGSTLPASAADLTSASIEFSAPPVFSFDCDAGTAEIDGFLVGGKQGDLDVTVQVFRDETFPSDAFIYTPPVSQPFRVQMSIPTDRPSEISVVANDVTIWGPEDTDCTSPTPAPGSYFGLATCGPNGTAQARVGYLSDATDITSVMVSYGDASDDGYDLQLGPLINGQFWATVPIQREGLTPVFVNVQREGGVYMYEGDRDYSFPERCAVSRLSGPDRFATSAAISKASFDPGVPVAYVTYGRNFPDALSVAPVAGIQGGPILLTETDTIPDV
ncbi:cell wall-binding repeat-containing protein, partial [Microbacterium sp. BK668]|uniref:cell wall-binding repeat-containing protein n=1 Tax=Microbacterium sp. BK668 TaxID=2512118 RepID=UPI00105D85D5